MADQIFTPVEFEEGFKRGEEDVVKVQVRRPAAGELRGLAVLDILRQEYAAVAKLAPRVTMPVITEADVAALSPADFMTLGSAIADFFMSRQAREAAGL
jgi:hypothetical protein